MPGFTAINAHAPSSLSPTSLSPSLDVAAKETVSGRRKATRRRQPARKQPAAHDAGQEASTETVSKRISGKGKKRASRVDDEPDPKRRKSNGIKSSMPTTKTTVGATTTVDPEKTTSTKVPSESSTEAGLVSLTSKAKLDGFRYQRQQAAVQSKIDPLSSQATSVYYTAETSMTSSLPQTTMQAVRNSSRGGSLLYSSSAALPTISQPVNPARPAIRSIPTPTSSSPVVVGSDPARQATGFTPTLVYSSQNDQNPNASQRLQPPVASHASTKETRRDTLRSSRHVLRSTSDDFGAPIDENDDELIELARRVEDRANSETSWKSPPSRARKLNIRDTHAHDDYGGALLTEEERKLLDAIKIPQDTRRPIARTKFPVPILDRTSLFGVSNTSALRTCFRVGEALNAGCQAVRNNRNLVLELYARIASSWREPRPSRKQHFIIHDLYHERPPFINGTFELWDQSALWEQDSKPFLEARADGMLCRMIAKMKRDGTKWRLEILSIWQADWEDVEHVASIYAKPVTEDGL